MNDYDPHVAIDLHTTNGTATPITSPIHRRSIRAPMPPIVDLLRKEWFPAVTKTIRAKYDWEYYYYGNVSAAGRRGALAARRGAQRWATFDHRPRFNNNYIGLRNRFALLARRSLTSRSRTGSWRPAGSSTRA